MGYYSRGLVNAVMGREDEAIEDFRAFLAWVDASVKETCRPYYRPSRESWIATLQSGGNPLDTATLRKLRMGRLRREAHRAETVHLNPDIR